MINKHANFIIRLPFNIYFAIKRIFLAFVFAAAALGGIALSTMAGAAPFTSKEETVGTSKAIIFTVLSHPSSKIGGGTAPSASSSRNSKLGSWFQPSTAAFFPFACCLFFFLLFSKRRSADFVSSASSCGMHCVDFASCRALIPALIF